MDLNNINNDRKLLGINTRNNFKDKIDYKSSYNNFNSEQTPSIKYNSNNSQSPQLVQNQTNDEISDIERSLKKRQLGNDLYQRILEKYNLKNTELTEHQLDELIAKYGIGEQKSNMNGFVTELKNIIKTNIQNYQISKETTVNEMNNEQLQQKPQKEHYICIDSNDRDKEKWPNANEYQILFGVNPNILGGDDVNKYGKISRSFISVKEIQLTNVILEPTEKLSRGYVLLHIEELGNNLFGTNENISKSIVQLSNYNLLDNKYYYYNVNSIKFFNTPIDINKLTVRFLYGDGELVKLNENIINIRVIM